MGVLPLYQAALDQDEAWGAKMEISCACGASMRLWDKRCPSCKAKNAFVRLLKKRKKIERWLDSRVRLSLMPELSKSMNFLEMSRKYNSVLSEVLRRSFPQQQKKEDVNMFMRRVVKFFPSMFKSTSPKKMAMDLSGSMKRSADAVSITTLKECDRIMEDALGATSEHPYGRLASEQALRISSDFLNVAKPYIEALKTLQLGHKRMVSAYEPVHEIFGRKHVATGARGMWNKARLKLRPVGKHVRLPTAIWEDDEEHEKLRRFDSQVDKFMSQAQWFLERGGQLQDAYDVLFKKYRLSLRKYMLLSISEWYKAANPERRAVMVKRFLSRKGVGFWLWRVLFGAGRE